MCDGARHGCEREAVRHHGVTGLDARGLERDEQGRSARVHCDTVSGAQLARELDLEHRHLAGLATGLAVTVQAAAGHQRHSGINPGWRDGLLLGQIELKRRTGWLV